MYNKDNILIVQPKNTVEQIEQNRRDILTLQNASGESASFSTGEKISEVAIVGEDLSLDSSLTVNSKINNESLIRLNNDQLLQDDITNEATTRADHDATLSGEIINEEIARELQDGLLLDSIGINTTNIEIEKGRNDFQDLSIQANSSNLLSLEELINATLLYAGRSNNGNATVIGTSPVNLPLPILDINSIFESLDGGITFTLKSGITLKAGTRIYWEQVFNFSLSQVSTTDRGTLTSYVNGTPYTVKEIDLSQNQTNGSFFVKNTYIVPNNTTTLSLTSQAVATNGNFTATLLANSYVLISSQNLNASVSTTTDNVVYNGINPSFIGQNQTTIDDNLQNLKADKIYVDNLIEALKLPIGSKIITSSITIPFSYGTWALIGQVGDGETLIGFSNNSNKGTFTNGEVIQHNHIIHLGSTGNDVNDGGNAKSFDSWTGYDIDGNATIFNVSDGDNNNDGVMISDIMYTNKVGGTSNKPAGLIIGLSYIWERMA